MDPSADPQGKDMTSNETAIAHFLNSGGRISRLAESISVSENELLAYLATRGNRRQIRGRRQTNLSVWRKADECPRARCADKRAPLFRCVTAVRPADQSGTLALQNKRLFERGIGRGLSSPFAALGRRSRAPNSGSPSHSSRKSSRLTCVPLRTPACAGFVPFMKLSAYSAVHGYGGAHRHHVIDVESGEASPWLCTLQTTAGPTTHWGFRRRYILHRPQLGDCDERRRRRYDRLPVPPLE